MIAGTTVHVISSLELPCVNRALATLGRCRYWIMNTTITTVTRIHATIVIQKIQLNSESMPGPCAEWSGGSHQLPQPSLTSAARADVAVNINPMIANMAVEQNFATAFFERFARLRFDILTSAY